VILRQDRLVRRQGNYITLINIKRARLRHWNMEVKTKKPEKLFPSPLFVDVKRCYKNRKT
jgi:hypothetical protein